MPEYCSESTTPNHRYGCGGELYDFFGFKLCTKFSPNKSWKLILAISFKDIITSLWHAESIATIIFTRGIMVFTVFNFPFQMLISAKLRIFLNIYAFWSYIFKKLRNLAEISIWHGKLNYVKNMIPRVKIIVAIDSACSKLVITS